MFMWKITTRDIIDWVGCYADSEYMDSYVVEWDYTLGPSFEDMDLFVTWEGITNVSKESTLVF